MEEHTPHTPHSEAPSSRAAAALRELQSRAQAMMTSRRERLSRLEVEITAKLDTIAETIAGERAAEADADTDAHEAQAEIERQREQLDEQSRQLDDRAEQLDELGRHWEAQQAAIGQQSAEFAEREEELVQRQQALDERQQALDEREQAPETSQAERDADEQTAAQRESAWQAEREALERERDALQAALAEARATADPSHEQSEAAAERDELKKKFALAHEDVQQFRTRVSELEEELAQRPEAGQADSAELVSLRAERDALAERIEALEQAQAAPQDEADSDQMSDLQRRFEMAVEDLRELKTRNAELESQAMAARRPPAGGGGDGGEMDWESQKRRLLASLEGDGEAAEDDDDPARQEERTSIASTIEITDAVVAEKDMEIEALKAQLVESNSKASSPDDEREKAVNELLDADEIVKQHREKIAQLEQEMEQKLRAAELELSVERARMARQKVELDHLQADLKSQRDSLASGGGSTTSGAPKRRWLSKLGLGGEDGQ